MSQQNRKWTHSLFTFTAFNAKGLLIRALIIAIVFFILHLAGLREYTSILSGTYPTGDSAATSAVFWGMVYIIVYFGFVLVAPILLITAGILFIFRVKSDSGSSARQSETNKN